MQIRDHQLEWTMTRPCTVMLGKYRMFKIDTGHYVHSSSSCFRLVIKILNGVLVGHNLSPPYPHGWEEKNYRVSHMSQRKPWTGDIVPNVPILVTWLPNIADTTPCLIGCKTLPNQYVFCAFILIMTDCTCTPLDTKDECHQSTK